MDLRAGFLEAPFPKVESTVGLRAKAKAKTKKVLHIDSSPSSSDKDSVYEELYENPAFNPAKFLNKARIGQSGAPAKAIAVLEGLQGAAEAVMHPKSAITSRATRKTAGSLAKSRPYLSRKADLDFLQAHEDLNEAKECAVDGDNSDEDLKNDAINDRAGHIESMERTRQSLRAAWVTTRHVQRVRAVNAVPPPPVQREEFFIEKDDCGYPEFQWGRWIAYKLVHGSHTFAAQYVDDFEDLPFDIDTLRRHVERLITVSAPLQELLSEIRAVYRWEDPVKTGKCLALYVFLWQISHIMSFVYGYIFFSTVMNYFCPRSVDDLRKEIARSMDRGATAFKAGEMIDKYGPDGWLKPLLDELGPHIQVQIGDFASLLEAVSNFYHFRSPQATVASLCLFAALFLLTAFSDSDFALRVAWFVLGVVFFGCWPIASRYPKYRLLVSPLKWALWNVPTHSELAFQLLNERATIAKQAIMAHESNDNIYVRTGRDSASFPSENEDDAPSSVTPSGFPHDEERDILSFGCTCHNIPGRFILSTASIRFTPLTSVTSHRSFHRPYSDLVEMSKRQTHSSILSPLVKVTRSMDKLELMFRGKGEGASMPEMGEREDAEVVLLENMIGRDRAFNAVVGFSGMKWQHLQKRPKSKQGEKGVAKDEAGGERF